jgi:uncharacterized protein (TIGR03067 family)
MENMKPQRQKAEPGPLDGDWNVVALEVDGQRMPAGMLEAAHIVVEGDRFQSLGMGAVYEGTLKLDPSANPKAFDLTFTAGPEKGNTALAIYELDGDDWKLCLTTRGGDRPKRFATAPGTGHALETLKRGKRVWTTDASTEAPAVESPESSGPATELEGEWSMVSGFMDGHPIESSMVKYGKRVTRGSQTTVQFGGQVFMKATFSLDPAKSPREIDFVHTQGMHQGKTQLGIYECDGKTLRLSSSTPDQPRPADFKPRKGDGKTVAEWKFEKK